MTTGGRFKGKTITCASTERIGEFTQLSNEFMEQIFALEPGEYLISDESDLPDFTDFGSSGTTETWKRITGVFGVSLADVGSERFVNIFAVITQCRNVH